MDYSKLVKGISQTESLNKKISEEEENRAIYSTVKSKAFTPNAGIGALQSLARTVEPFYNIKNSIIEQTPQDIERENAMFGLNPSGDRKDASFVESIPSEVIFWGAGGSLANTARKKALDSLNRFLYKKGVSKAKRTALKKTASTLGNATEYGLRSEIETYGAVNPIDTFSYKAKEDKQLTEERNINRVMNIVPDLAMAGASKAYVKNLENKAIKDVFKGKDVKINIDDNQLKNLNSKAYEYNVKHNREIFPVDDEGIIDFDKLKETTGKSEDELFSFIETKLDDKFVLKRKGEDGSEEYLINHPELDGYIKAVRDDEGNFYVPKDKVSYISNDDLLKQINTDNEVKNLFEPFEPKTAKTEAGYVNLSKEVDATGDAGKYNDKIKYDPEAIAIREGIDKWARNELLSKGIITQQDLNYANIINPKNTIEQTNKNKALSKINLEKQRLLADARKSDDTYDINTPATTFAISSNDISLISNIQNSLDQLGVGKNFRNMVNLNNSGYVSIKENIDSHYAINDIFDNYKNNRKIVDNNGNETIREPSALIDYFFRDAKNAEKAEIKRPVKNLIDFAYKWAIIDHLAKNDGSFASNAESSIAKSASGKLFDMINIRVKDGRNPVELDKFRSAFESFFTKEVQKNLKGVIDSKDKVFKIEDGKLVVNKSIKDDKLTNFINSLIVKNNTNNIKDILHDFSESIKSLYKDATDIPSFGEPKWTAKDTNRLKALGFKDEQIKFFENLANVKFVPTKHADVRIKQLKNYVIKKDRHKLVKLLDDEDIKLWRIGLKGNKVAKKIIDDKLDALEKEILFADRMLRDYKVSAGKRGEGIYFTPDYLASNRAMYNEVISPQTSNIILGVIEPEGKSIVNKNNINEWKRFVATLFDIKPEKIKDDSLVSIELDKLFNNIFEPIVKTRIKKKIKLDEPLSDAEIENIVSMLRKYDRYDKLKTFVNIDRVYQDYLGYIDFKSGKTDKFITSAYGEIDSINSNRAITSALVKEPSEILGVGAENKLYKHKDFYEIALEEFKKGGQPFGDSSDFKITRSDFKTIVTGVGYNGIPYNLVGTFSDILIKKIILSDVNSFNNFVHRSDFFQSIVNDLNANLTKEKLDIIDRLEKIRRALYSYKETNLDNDLKTAILYLESSTKTIRELNDVLDYINKQKNIDKAIKSIEKQLDNFHIGDEFYVYSLIRKLTDENQDKQDILKDRSSLFYKAYSMFKTTDEITDSEKLAVDRYMQKYFTNRLENAIASIESESIKKLKSTFMKTVDTLYVAFDSKYNEKLHTDVKGITNSLRDFYNSVGKDFTNNDSYKIETYLAGKKFSIRDVIEALEKNELLIDEILYWKPLFNISPKLKNSFGENVLLTEISSKATIRKLFDGKYFQSRGLSIKDNPFALYIISHDASIMERSFKNGVSRWDAVISTFQDGIDFAKDANKVMADIIGKSNIAKSFYESIDEAIRGINKPSSLEWISTQRTVQRKSTLDLKTKEKIKDDFRKTFNNLNKLQKELKEFGKEIEERTKEIAKKPIVVDNYSIGGGYAEFKGMSNGLLNKEYVFNPKRKVSTKVVFDDLSYLEDVDINEDIVPSFDFTVVGRLSETFDFEIAKTANIGTQIGKAEVIGRGRNRKFRILINNNSLFSNNFSVISHEIWHLITGIDNNKHYAGLMLEKGADTYIKYINELFTSDRIKIYDSNGKDLTPTFHNKSTSELLAMFGDALSMNDATISNPAVMAKILNKRNLRNEIKDIYIDGQKIHTFRDFKDFLKANGRDDVAYQFKQAIDLYATAINHPDIKQVLEGENVIKSKTYMDYINKNGKILEVVNKANYSIQKVDVFEFLAMTPQKEALMKFANMSIAFDNQYIAISKEFYSKLARETSKLSFGETGSKNVGNKLGIGVWLGLHKHLNDIERFRDFDDFLRVKYEELDNWAENLAKQIAGKRDYEKVKSKILKVIKHGSLEHRGYRNAKAIANKLASIAKFPTKLDRIRFIESMKDEVEYYASIYRIRQNKSMAKKYYDGYHEILNSSNRDILKEKIAIWENTKNEKSLFGINPVRFLSENSLRFKVDNNPENSYGKLVIKEKGIKKVYFLHIAHDYDAVLGKQNEQFVNANPNRFIGGEIYRFGDGESYFSPGNVDVEKLLEEQAMEFDIDKMISKNANIRDALKYSDMVMREQIKVLVNAGILKTKEYYDKLPNRDKDKYVPVHGVRGLEYLTKNYGEYYIHQSYSYHILGTSGINVSHSAERLFGKDIAKILTGLIKTTTFLTKSLKTPILTWRASSYLNSLISSTWIYAVHADEGINPAKSYNWAKEQQNNLRSMFKELADLRLELAKTSDIAERKKIKSKIDKKMKELNNSEAFVAMKHGIMNTLRTEDDRFVEDLGTMRMYKQMGRTFDNDQLERIFKTIALQRDSKLGEIYDNTEVIPKLMLYHNKINSGMDKEMAAQYVMMANPYYGNQNQLLAVIDEFIPFISYRASVPRMISFALVNKPYRFFAMYATFKSAVIASWEIEHDELTTKEKWMKENGFINLIWFGKSTDSMNPYNLYPADIGTGFFAYDVLGQIADVDINGLFIGITPKD